MAILVLSPNGTHTTKTTLESARTAADAAGKTVVVTSALTQAQSNITAAWPTDRALEIKKGGSIANSTTFTINGPFSAGDYQVFAGAGAVTGLKEANPTWFGAKGDGSTDDTIAIVSAIASSKVIEFTPPSVYYKTTAPIKVPALTTLRGKWNHTGFVGDVHQDKPGIRKTTNTTVDITPYSGGAAVARDCIFYADPVAVQEGGDGYFTQKIEIRDLNIQGAGASLVDYAIYLEEGGTHTFVNLDISDVKYAVYGASVWSTTFTNVHAQARYYVANGTSIKFDSCSSMGSSHGFDGFYMDNVQYSSMINCTGDLGHESTYTFKTSYGITLVSCGTEFNSSTGANIGTMYNFLGKNQVTVIGGFGVTEAGTKPKISVMPGDIITFKNSGFFTGTGTGPDIYVNNDAAVTAGPAQITFEDTHFTDFSTDNATVSFQSGTNTSVVTVKYGNYSKIFTSAGSFRKFGTESGTWTPTILFDGVSTGITYDAATSGSYSISGNTCTMQGHILLTSKGAATGVASIGGFPYNSKNFGTGTIGFQAALGKRGHLGITAGDNKPILYDQDINSQYITNTDFANNTNIFFSATFQLPDSW